MTVDGPMNTAWFELASEPEPVGGAPRWPLRTGMVIGRSPDADISLNVAELSREHARVDQTRGGWSLIDLDSRNGTWVDGERVADAPVPLRSGGTVVVAGRVTLRFVDQQATPFAPAIGRITGLWIDPDTRAVWIDARRVEPPLSDRQLRLLELLHAHEGQVVDRPTIIAEVWSEVAADGVSDDAVSALIKRVRARLREYETGFQHVDVVRTRGVRFRNPS